MASVGEKADKPLATLFSTAWRNGRYAFCVDIFLKKALLRRPHKRLDRFPSRGNSAMEQKGG